jgi:hypothetical protein
VGSRTEASETPIQKDHSGSRALYSAKDRNGGIEPHSELQRTVVGVLSGPVRGRRPTQTSWASWTSYRTSPQPRPTTPESPEDGKVPGKHGALAEAVKRCVEKDGRRRRYPSERQLQAWLRTDGVSFTSAELGVALVMLEERGELIRPETGLRKPRPRAASRSNCPRNWQRNMALRRTLAGAGSTRFILAMRLGSVWREGPRSSRVMMARRNLTF